MLREYRLILKMYGGTMVNSDRLFYIEDNRIWHFFKGFRSLGSTALTASVGDTL